MHTEEAAFDLIMRDTQMVQYTDKVAAHRLDWFRGGRRHAKEALEMDRSRELVVFQSCTVPRVHFLGNSGVPSQWTGPEITILSFIRSASC
jgi:hypothetical protein